MLCSVCCFEGADLEETPPGICFLSPMGPRHRDGGRKKWKGHGVSMACDLWEGGSVVSEVSGLYSVLH